MAKHDVIVNVGFKADTSQIKNALNELDKSLKNIQKLPGRSSSLFDDREIREASQAALELEKHLRAAMDVKTGNLDLSRFSASLKVSNKSLQDYYNKLISVGPNGQQAFYQLAQAISTAETPTLRVNKALDGMIDSLKKTVNWQISSSVVHGFMGAVQKAYGYAQDLNESLNNIRIVTGQNTDQMAAFAEKANKAARALSTTTTEYTNAALIYYQQGGMSDAEIAERTDITIKMANASRTSAETVSDQMTSIWNNFYDGSKSLEYYTDVLTALGAVTASSSDEIVEGVQKFAAVGDTVGLSYEYAASALATVTATTRESADVVGTAFKTLFARIQGLQLGETLDDGTSLNKYSQALDSVGISIFETSGEIKAMDKILDELGNKWNNLAKDQQTALAQTVAGVRQYTQLIALMDNWDFFQQNLAISYGAEGTLDEQAQIYAESWEAARNRVKAAAEDIYDSLINDDFFINILNGTEKALNALSGFVDGIGGLEGILSAVGGIFLNIYAKRMPETLDNLKQNIMVFSGLATKSMIDIQQKTREALQQEALNPRLTEAQKIQNVAMQTTLTLREELVKNSKNLTAQQIQEEEARIRNVEAMYKEAAMAGKVLDGKKKEAESLMRQTKFSSFDQGGIFAEYQKIAKKQKNLRDLQIQFKDDPQKQLVLQEKINDTNSELLDLEDRTKSLFKTINKFLPKNSGIKKFNLQDVRDFDKEGDLVLNFSEDEINERLQILQKEANKIIDITLNEFQTEAKKHGALTSFDLGLSGQIKEWGKLTDTDKNINGFRKTVERYVDEIERLNKSGKFGDAFVGEDGTNKADKAIKNLRNSLGDGSKSIKDIVNDLKEFRKELDLGNVIVESDNKIRKLSLTLSSLDLSPEQINALEKAFEELEEAGVNVDNMLENILASMGQGMKPTVKFSEVMTNFGAAVMTTHAMLESFNYSMKILGDESTSSLEKFGAVLSLLATFGSAAGSITKTASSLKGLVDGAGGISKILPGLGKGLKTVGAGMTTVGAGANMAAKGTASLSSSLIAILPYIALVVAALALLTIGVQKLIDLYENWKSQQPEEQLKAAQENARTLTEELEKAKNASENLRNSIESYDTAVDKIKTLTVGTNEWRQAIEEANEYARELINTYDLMGQYTFDADTGLISFNDNALENIQEVLNNKVQSLSTANILAQNLTLEKENINDIKQRSKEYVEEFYSTWLKNALTTIGGMAATGAVAGSGFGTVALPVVGTVSGAAIGAIGGTVAGAVGAGAETLSQYSKVQNQNNQAESAINQLLEKYIESSGNFSTALDSLSDEQKKVLKTLGYTDVELSNLCAELYQNTSAVEQNNKILGNDQLSGNSAYDNLDSETKNYVSEVYGKNFQQLVKDQLANKYADLDNAEIAKEYSNRKDLGFRGVQNDAALFVDNQGNEITLPIGIIKTQLAEQDVENRLNENEEIGKLTRDKEKIDFELNKKIEELKKIDELNDAKNYNTILNGSFLGELRDKIDWESYYNNSEIIQELLKRKTLVEHISDFADMNQEQANDYVEKILNTYNNIDLQSLIEASTNSKSFDEFQNLLLTNFRALETQKYQELGNNIKEILTESLDTEELNTEALKNNQEFLELLKEENLDYTSFLNLNYEKRYSYLVEFYGKTQKKAKENAEKELDSQKNLLKLYKQVQDYQKDSRASDIKNKYYSEEVIELATKYNDTELQSIIDKINNKIEEINTDLEITFKWDEIDIFAASKSKVAEFSKFITDDIKKINGKYQFTAEQAREWMEIYPKLFENAIVASDGLIEINDNYVKEFIEGQQTTVDSAIQAKITLLEVDKEELENELKNLKISKEALQKSLDTEQDLEANNAEVLEIISAELLKVYTNHGIDRLTAEGIILNQLQNINADYWKQTSMMQSTSPADWAKTQLTTMSKEEKVQTIIDNSLGFNLSTSKNKKNWEFKLNNSDIVKWNYNSLQEGLEGAKNYFNSVADEALNNLLIPYIAEEFNRDFTIVPPTSEELEEIFKSALNSNEFDDTNYKEAQKLFNQQALNNINTLISDKENKILEIENAITYLNSLKLRDLNKLEGLEDIEGLNAVLEETAERYHEIIRSIKYYEAELKKIQIAKEQAYGKDKLILMDQEIEYLEKLKTEQEELNKVQNLMIETDKVRILTINPNRTNYEELKTLQDSLNIPQAQFSELTGELLNYDKIIKAYDDAVFAIEEKINATKLKSEDTKELEKELENAQTLRNETVNDISLYEKSLDEARTSAQELLDIQNQIFDENYEKLTLELDLDLKIRDSEMKEIEYALNQLSDDSFANIEAFGLWEKKFKHANDTLWDYNANYQTLLENRDKYTDTQFIEHIETVRDGIYEQLNALTEYDKQMKEFYGDTLQKAQDEIGKYTDQMESLTDTLEHYKNLVELINGEYDFENIGIIIDGQTETTYNDLIQAQKDFELIKKQYNDAQVAIANAQSEKERLTLEKAFESLVPAYDQAWQEVLSKTEQYVQLLKDKLEHKMNEAAHAMEMAFTDGLGFDFLNDSMDRAENYADEFLTKTNQIYEIQKLMRAAQTASDKTDNAAAKARLANFAQDTQRLQEKNQLSNYELEIQQAKYDLLLAQIALEEAQDAKSTVRLQRTSEGTFGYVYTADEEKIADAEQKMADEQNDLYNILREGEEDYAKKIYETEQDLTEALIDLAEKRANGQFESEEEYQNAVLQTKEEFGRMLEFYEEMRNLSFSEDYLWRKDLADNIINSIYKAESDLVQNTIVQTGLYTESWTTSYDAILAKSKNWSEYSTEYINTCETAFKEWQTNVSNDNIKVQEKLSNTSIAVKDLTDKSAELAKKLDTEVRDKAEKTLIQVANLTTAYGEQILEVDALKESYHKLIEEMNEYLKLNNTIVPPEDYSLAMANYIRNGGDVGDLKWNKYEQERTSKMNEAQYMQYQSTSGLFNELMLQYDTYRGLGQKNALTDYVDNIIDTKGIWDFELIKQLIQTVFSNSVQLDTGGYTGSWGTSGKLAVLHEKELVLNESDTSNFLIASGILRDIAKLIDINSIANRLTGISDIWNNNLNTSNNLEQSVQIEAHFPNATDKNEIEEAFNNLINTATQYAYRN